MQAGIVAADKLVTVSQAYAMEVLQLPQQQGLQLLLAQHKERLVRPRPGPPGPRPLALLHSAPAPLAGTGAGVTTRRLA
jgi:hypothetical protein